MFIPLITQHIKSNVRFSFGTESTSSSSLGQFWTINYRFIEGNNSKNYWPAKRRRNKKDFVWKWFSLKLMVTIFAIINHDYERSFFLLFIFAIRDSCFAIAQYTFEWCVKWWVKWVHSKLSKLARSSVMTENSIYLPSTLTFTQK